MKVTYFSQIKSKILRRDLKKTLKQHIKVFPVIEQEAGNIYIYAIAIRSTSYLINKKNPPNIFRTEATLERNTDSTQNFRAFGGQNLPKSIFQGIF